MEVVVLDRFSGDTDPEDWIYRAERYFTFLGFSEEHWLPLPSFYLDGEALEWFRWMFRNRQFFDWNHFKKKLVLRFWKRSDATSPVVNAQITKILALLQKMEDRFSIISPQVLVGDAGISAATVLSRERASSLAEETGYVDNVESHPESFDTSIVEHSSHVDNLFDKMPTRVFTKEVQETSSTSRFVTDLEEIESPKGLNKSVHSCCPKVVIEVQPETPIKMLDNESPGPERSEVQLFDECFQRDMSKSVNSSVVSANGTTMDRYVWDPKIRFNSTAPTSYIDAVNKDPLRLLESTDKFCFMPYASSTTQVWDPGQNSCMNSYVVDMIENKRVGIETKGISLTETSQDRLRKAVVRITTGSQALDELLGRGIETSAITEAFGEFRSGKTQLAHTLCVSTQLPTSMKGGNGKVAYIDTEGTIRLDRVVPIAERFGMDAGAVLDNIIYARAYTYERQYNLLLGLAAKMAEEPFRLLIVDSVIALIRVDFTGRGELADRQQKLAQMLSRLIKIAEEFNVAVYLTNQAIADPGGGVFISDPKKPAGGHILAHAATIRLMFRKSKGEQRVCKVFDAPNLPESEAIFQITAGGMADAKGAPCFSESICLVGWLAIIFGRNISRFNIGSVLMGYGVWVISFMVPTYITKITPKYLRESLLIINQPMICCGGSLIIQLFGLILIQDSPRWLTKANHWTACTTSLQYFKRNTASISATTASVEEFIPILQILSKDKMLECLKMKCACSLVIGVRLVVLHQIGQVKVAAYCAIIFVLVLEKYISFLPILEGYVNNITRTGVVSAYGTTDDFFLIFIWTCQSAAFALVEISIATSSLLLSFVVGFLYSNLEDKVLIGAEGIVMNGPGSVLAKQPNTELNGYVWDPG